MQSSFRINCQKSGIIYIIFDFFFANESAILAVDVGFAFGFIDV